MNKTIIHFGTDEKYMNNIIWMFEKINPKNNTYIILVPSPAYKLKYLKTCTEIELYCANPKSDKRIISDLIHYDLSILHGLNFFNSKIVLKAPSKTKFLWLLLGAEIYNNPYLHQKHVFGAKTHEVFQTKNSFKNSMKNYIYDFIYFLRHGTLNPQKSIAQAAKKVEYLGATLEEDFQLFRQKNYISKFAKYIYFAHYPAELLFKDIHTRVISGNQILLGNSASKSNNHLELFEILEKKDIGDKKVLTPLSYGDSKYADKIIEVGYSKFSYNFTPITKFMDAKNYYKLLCKCNVTIMNHYRQEAFGLILAMLWMGSKVFLHPKNTIYPFLKRIGIQVFCIVNDLENNDSSFLEPLTETQITENREILLKNFGSDRITKSLTEGINKILI